MTCDWGEDTRDDAQRPAKLIVDGGGILDIAKNLTRTITGRKVVGKLAEKAGRKIGKEAATSIGKKGENACDRIREIVEANSMTRSDPRSALVKPIQEKRQARSGGAPGESLSHQKVNEAVSRLLADDA